MFTRYLTYDQMANLTTPRLLAYKNKQLGMRPSPCGKCWRCEENDGEDCDRLIEYQEYENALRNAKSILATREHVPR